MSCRRLAAIVDATRQVVPSVALATALAFSVFGPPRAVGAAPGPQRTPDRAPVGPLAPLPPPEPANHLQVIIKSVNIANDRDWIGGAEMLLTANIWRCSGTFPTCSASDAFPAVLLAEMNRSLNGDSGDTVTLDRMLPQAGDVKEASSTSEETGFEVYAGQRYLLTISAFERDVSGGDFMGGVQQVIDESNGWAIGLHEREPAGRFEDTSLPSLGGFMCAGCGGIIIGDYLVTYEIRPTALPDLHPASARVERLNEKQPEVCTVIENNGTRESGRFEVTIRVDNQLIGTSGVADLAAGQSQDLCRQSFPLTYGQHTLAVSVDGPRAVTELKEDNNDLVQPYLRTVAQDVVNPGASTSVLEDAGSDPPPDDGPPILNVGTIAPVVSADPNPKPSGGGPILTAPAPSVDLVVTDIRVEAGQQRANSQCVAGKHDVTVVVKNQGGGKATGFSVRLVAGSQDAAPEQTVQTLEAGKEEQIKFSGVQLGKGTTKLTAVADSKSTIAESKEDNNEREKSVTCQ